MTWVEVVDTAVKISLGALLAGAFGYFTAKLSHESERRARHSERRRDHLEGVLALLNEVENKYVNQKWRLEAYRFHRDCGENEKAEEEKRHFDQVDNQLYEAVARFMASSSVLLLLGETKADALLWVYRDAVNDWLENSVLDATEFPEDRKEAIVAKVRSAREELFRSLAKAYRES